MEWEKHKNHYDNLEKLMSAWCNKYRYLYDETSIDEKARILDYVYDEFDKSDTFNAINSINRWLSKIE